MGRSSYQSAPSAKFPLHRAVGISGGPRWGNSLDPDLDRREGIGLRGVAGDWLRFRAHGS